MPTLFFPAALPSRPLLATFIAVGICVVAAAPRAARAAPEAEGSDLLKRVQTIYGQSRGAIRSVEFEYDYDVNGMIRRARYARDGDRYHMAAAWVSDDGGMGMPHERSWDGQRSHHRSTRHQVNRTSDRKQFTFSADPPETYRDFHVSWALGFEDELQPNFRREPDQKYRFLRGQLVEDPGHGTCVELEFAAEYADSLLVSRHARRYAYAPVYYRFGKTREGAVPDAELTDVRYAAIESDGNELYFPVELTLLAVGGKKNAGGNTLRWRVDEKKLKINQPITRSRFVIEPWPNEALYDADKDKLTPAKDPAWSPVGKVEFPWNDWTVLTAEDSAERAGNKAARMTAGGMLAYDPPKPWAEALGVWLVVPGLAIVLGAGYVLYRKRRVTS